MQHAIIGSGNVGSALARQFARSGIAVGIANTRGPESLAALAREAGDKVRPMSLEDALDADVVILAVPFRAHAAIALAAEQWGGKIVVDAMNTYGVAPEELQGRASTDLVASAFLGAKVVKTFNQLPARLLGAVPGEAGGRRVMFVASNDPAASGAISKLVDDLGFAPVELGRIDEGGALLDKSGPLVLLNLVKLS